MHPRLFRAFTDWVTPKRARTPDNFFWQQEQARRAEYRKWLKETGHDHYEPPKIDDPDISDEEV